jgi:pimeloyl-ACP methyl ester carboxylesterase
MRVIPIVLALLIPMSLCHAQADKSVPAQAAPVPIDARLTPHIGGLKQLVHIQTDDARKPVLLFLSGGPGSSMIRNGNAFTSVLKSRFTIVHWDQRDAGETLKLNPSPVQPSLAQMEQDTRDVIEFVRKETGKDKIYLLGSSWGNVLGFHIVKTHPEWLHGYVAVNPVINQMASEKHLLGSLKTHFKDHADARTELALVNIPFKADEDLFYLRKWLFHKEGKAFATSSEFKTGFLQWSKTWSPVWRDVMDINLTKSLKKVDTPIYFLVGKNDIQTYTPITQGYFEQLQAPKKEIILFEHSGHQIHQEEPEKFQQTLLKILPAAGS